MADTRIKPVPADFAQRAAEGINLAKHYGVSRKKITKWRQECGITKRRGGSAKMPLPADFLEVATDRPRAYVERHYGVGREVAQRWRKLAGLTDALKSGIPPRPLPDDFQQLARRHGNRWLMKHYGAGEAIILRWRREVSIAGRNIAMPDDFAAVVEGKSQIEVREHYGRSWNLVKRWYEEAGIPLPKKKYRVKDVPIPADFADSCHKMLRKELLAHYKIGARRLNTWLKQTGLKPRVDVHHVRRKEPRKPPAPRPVVKRVVVLPPAPRQAARDISLEGRAAEHIRIVTRAFVNRCTEKGGSDPKGKFWRVGMSVLTPDEMIQRARERYGFEPFGMAA